MKMNGFDYPDYPEETTAYEMGVLDFERGNGQNPWSRGAQEAFWWRGGYIDAMRRFEAWRASA